MPVLKHPLQVILEAAERSVFAHQGILAVSLVPEAFGSLVADVMDELLLVDPRRTSSDGDNAARVVTACRNMRILRNDPLVVCFPGVPFGDVDPPKEEDPSEARLQSGGCWGGGPRR